MFHDTALAETAQSTLQLGCKLCGRHFRAVEAMESHIKSHLEDLEHRPYLCSICEVRFAWQGALAIHSFTVTIPPCSHFLSLPEDNRSDAAQRWPSCDRSFVSHEDLGRHLRGDDDSECYKKIAEWELVVLQDLESQLRELKAGTHT